MKMTQCRSPCPDCTTRMELFPLLHHMICAYVGPAYDFPETESGYRCPKCGYEIVSNDPACEIVGTTARCPRCAKEVVLPPPSIDNEI